MGTKRGPRAVVSQRELVCLRVYRRHVPFVVKPETRRGMLRHIAAWGDKAPRTGRQGSGRGVAVALASLYVVLALVVAAIALGGFLLATAITQWWLAAPVGVGAPVFAALLWRLGLGEIDTMLRVVAGTRVAPPYWPT
jgi:hypothetical protein